MSIFCFLVQLSYLKVDYDRFIDSDSEDDDDDGEVENDNGQTEEVVEKPLALAQSKLLLIFQSIYYNPETK